MKPDPLRGPKLKLERAKQHIRDTETAIRDFISGNPYEMFTEIDPPIYNVWKQQTKTNKSPHPGNSEVR